MQIKLSRYLLLSFISFLFFTLVFHTAAYANSETIAETVPTIPLQPTPTIFVYHPVPTQAPIIQKANLPTPSPTIFIAPIKPTETPIPTKKVIETITPTQVPVTPIPTEVLPSPTIITPPPTAPVVTDLEALFSKYSSEFSVDKELLKRIARCESGFNTNANNSGLYLGMFQFGSQTWISNRSRMGLDTNPDLRTNAEESIRTAAFMISRGGQHAWPNCQ